MCWFSLAEKFSCARHSGDGKGKGKAAVFTGEAGAYEGLFRRKACEATDDSLLFPYWTTCSPVPRRVIYTNFQTKLVQSEVYVSALLLCAPSLGVSLGLLPLFLECQVGDMSAKNAIYAAFQALAVISPFRRCGCSFVLVII